MDETKRGYLIAIIATSTAFLVRWLLQPLLNRDSPLMVFTIAVIIAALWGGFAPGIMATGLSAVLAVMFFLPPAMSPRVDGTSGTIQLLLFLFIGVAVSAMARSVAISRRQAEESELYLASIIETTTSGLLVLDRNGFITFANPAAADLFGLMPSHLIGRRYDDPGWGASNLDGKPLQESEMPAARVLATGESLTGVHITVRRPDDSLLALMVNASPLRDQSNGTISGVVLALNRLGNSG